MITGKNYVEVRVHLNNLKKKKQNMNVINSILNSLGIADKAELSFDD